MNILLICVNYFNDQETQLFVSNLLARSDVDNLEVVVVDNSKTLGCSRLDVSGERCIVLRPNENLGYFGGVKWAYDNWISYGNRIPDFVVVSNTDIEVSDDNFFDGLLPFLNDDYIGVIAPAVISAETGLDQNPYMASKPSMVKAAIRAKLFKSAALFIAYQWLARIKRDVRLRTMAYRNPIASTKEIYAPHGSFMVFCRAYFEKGGTFDHPLFLYGEEVFVASELERLGLRALYVPHLRVVHNEHSTTCKMHSRVKAQYASSAADYVMRILRCGQ